MIHWFMKRGQRSMLLLGAPAAVMAFVLLNTAFSTQSSEQEENSDGGIGKAFEEVFSAINPADPADVYIQWDLPKSAATEGQYDSAGTNWFLGAYKSVSRHGSDGVVANETLGVALDRTRLPADNLEFTIHYFDAENSFLFIDLLDANGLLIAENLYGDLLDGSGEDRVLSLDVALDHFLNAAVIQLRCGAGIVFESRLYINQFNANFEGGLASGAAGGARAPESESWPVELSFSSGRAGASGSAVLNSSSVAPENSVLLFFQVKNQKSQIENIIYVDQRLGSDRFTGRSPFVCGQDGPKKTIRNGLAVAEEADTLVIKSGIYEENLDINYRNLNVFIEGDVKL